MKKYRILTNIFDEFFVERKKCGYWKRYAYTFKSQESAETFIRKEKASNIGCPWILKEINIVT